MGPDICGSPYGGLGPPVSLAVGPSVIREGVRLDEPVRRLVKCAAICKITGPLLVVESDSRLAVTLASVDVAYFYDLERSTPALMAGRAVRIEILDQDPVSIDGGGPKRAVAGRAAALVGAVDFGPVAQ